jgi:mannose-6-phosphate isomerase-like protein (cupin superfamily)
MEPTRVETATVVVPAEEVEARPWLPLPDAPGVTYKALWRAGRSVAGLMRLGPGAGVAPHTHDHAHHHVWVVTGSCQVLGHEVTAGSYAHIPAGVEHAVHAGPDGCTFFYIYEGAPGDGA